MRKNTLFTVPLYCIAAGVISFYLIVYGVGRFAVVTAPDGTLTSDTGRTLLIYGFIFAASLAIGGPLLFARLTKKEIARSATIVVVFDLLLVLAQQLLDVTGPLAVTFTYLAMVTEWSSFIPLLLLHLTGLPLLCAIVGALTPYLFVLFGKKKLDQ